MQWMTHKKPSYMNLLNYFENELLNNRGVAVVKFMLITRYFNIYCGTELLPYTNTMTFIWSQNYHGTSGLGDITNIENYKYTS